MTSKKKECLVRIWKILVEDANALYGIIALPGTVIGIYSAFGGEVDKATLERFKYRI